MRAPRIVLLPLILLAASAGLPPDATTHGLRPLTDDPNVDYHPVFSPSGDQILFTSRGADPPAMFLLDVDGGVPRRVPVNLTGDLYADWAPDGTSIVFDARRGDAPGDIYRFWFETGALKQLTDDPAMDGQPDFSPAGDRIVFTSMRGGNPDIWIMEASGERPTRLTDHPARDWHPRWAPTGDRILFSSSRDGAGDIWVVGSDGTNLTKLTSMPGLTDRAVWSPDGTRVLFQCDDDLWVVDATGGTPTRLTDFPGSEGNATWSPDGRTIAFVSDRTGNRDLWLLTLPSDHDTDYLGQPRPGDTPVLFAPGVVSTDAGMYGTIVFSPRQDEAFWAKDEHPALFFSRLVDGRWTAPSEFPFKEGYRLSSPFYAVDGHRLYFLAARLGPDGIEQDDRIWVVDRDADGWGEARELDPAVNAVKKHWQFSLDRNGTLYFMGEGADIYVAELQDGRYRPPARLPAPVNTDAPETGPNVTPDGNVLLFTRWFESAPYIRIMLSRRGAAGGWDEPIDLTPYLGEGNNAAARLSPDGKYLFFQSQREGSDPNRSVYWRSADFIADLPRPPITPSGR